MACLERLRLGLLLRYVTQTAVEIHIINREKDGIH